MRPGWAAMLTALCMGGPKSMGFVGKVVTMGSAGAPGPSSTGGHAGPGRRNRAHCGQSSYFRPFHFPGRCTAGVPCLIGGEFAHRPVRETRAEIKGEAAHLVHVMAQLRIPFELVVVQLLFGMAVDRDGNHVVAGYQEGTQIK